MIVEEGDNQINYRMIGELSRGDKIGPIKLILYNDEGTDRNNILIKGSYSKINQIGLPIDTMDSLFISLDGLNAELEKIVSIKDGERIPFYVEYQPRWIAEFGDYQFTLLIKDLNI